VSDGDLYVDAARASPSVDLKKDDDLVTRIEEPLRLVTKALPLLL
jgi:hypothetical protein